MMTWCSVRCLLISIGLYSCADLYQDGSTPISPNCFPLYCCSLFPCSICPSIGRGIHLRWHQCSSGASGEFPESKHCTLWAPVWKGSNDAHLKESFSGPEWRENKTCVFMWLADFPCLLRAARGWLWHESRDLSAHRQGEYLPHKWQTYKLTFPVCVCSPRCHRVCPGWCDDLGRGETSLCTTSDVVCTDKAPSFLPLGFMCFLILVSSITGVVFSLCYLLV